MKINRPTENRVVVPFKDIDIGSCFELDGGLYIRREDSAEAANALMLHERGCQPARIASETQCVLVDVEISYAYRRPEKDERND